MNIGDTADIGKLFYKYGKCAPGNFTISVPSGLFSHSVVDRAANFLWTEWCIVCRADCRFPGLRFIIGYGLQEL